MKTIEIKVLRKHWRAAVKALKKGDVGRSQCCVLVEAIQDAGADVNSVGLDVARFNDFEHNVVVSSLPAEAVKMRTEFDHATMGDNWIDLKYLNIKFPLKFELSVPDWAVKS